MNAGQRLAALTLGAGPGAGARLLALVGHAGAAGALLAAYSGLPSGAAAVHLLAEQLTPAVRPPRSGGRMVGLHFKQARPDVASRKARRRFEELLLVMKP